MSPERTEEWRKEFNEGWKKLGVINEIDIKTFSRILDISFREQVAHTDFRKILREMVN